MKISVTFWYTPNKLVDFVMPVDQGANCECQKIYYVHSLLIFIYYYCISSTQCGHIYFTPCLMQNVYIQEHVQHFMSLRK